MNAPWDVQWTTRDGRVLRVGDMDRQHRQNTMAYLLRHAKALHAREIWRFPCPGDTVSIHTSDAFEREFDELVSLSAHEWMRAEPIYQALAAITFDGPGTSPRRWQNRLAAQRAADPIAFLEWLQETAA